MCEIFHNERADGRRTKVDVGFPRQSDATSCDVSGNIGRDGGRGKVEMSGVRWKTAVGSVGRWTTSVALHDVSPDSLSAVHVYIPVSDRRRSTAAIV